MAHAARVGKDNAESVIVASSKTVFINGSNAATEGGTTAKGHIINSGSQTVFVEGKRLARQGDSTNKGANIRSGSPDVDAG